MNMLRILFNNTNIMSMLKQSLALNSNISYNTLNPLAYAFMCLQDTGLTNNDSDYKFKEKNMHGAIL